MWVRGLKLINLGRINSLTSRILCGCVDWNSQEGKLYFCGGCRILCGCVDWNQPVVADVKVCPGRILCGCVDWNKSRELRRALPHCRILCGCVDWNLIISVATIATIASHPMWVRGLKLQLTHLHCSIDESHPMWVRGLKQPSEVVVASSDSRILCGCVDWNKLWLNDSKIVFSRILCGCVDWNIKLRSRKHAEKSRILCGCVDWNRNPIIRKSLTIVASYVGAWIETFGQCQRNWGLRGRILCGCVDWNLPRPFEIAPAAKSHPMWVRGLKPNMVPLLTVHIMSHPMWVRGLKLARNTLTTTDSQSHPMWVRGLKQTIQASLISNAVSHPMWVRGLKRASKMVNSIGNDVASYVGAWIETSHQ